MARDLGFLVLALLVLAASCESAVFSPMSESHRSAALELFSPADGSFPSLEATYEALKTFEVLGIEKKHGIKTSSCASVADTLSSTSSALKDIFHALSVNSILKCELNSEAFRGTESRLKGSLDNANSLTDFYYSIRGLVLLKDQTSEVDVQLGDADRIYRSIKALGQSDGRWRLSSNNPESSNSAAGNALEALAGVISLASPQIDPSLELVTFMRNLLEHVDIRFLSASASVVRGTTAVAGVTPENLHGTESRLKGSLDNANSLTDFYYSIRGDPLL